MLNPIQHNFKVAENFSQGAAVYDDNALIQSHVSRQLIQNIFKGHQHQLKDYTVLDIACSTGLRARELSPQCHRYFLGDISETMLQNAISNCPQGFPVRFDAENPCFTASFDMIISSLTLHWLENPKKGLEQLIGCLKPGGHLYLTCMGANSFHQWKTAHSLLGESCGTPDFIPLGALKSWLPPQGERNLREEWITQDVSNPLTFFKNLKKIGAGKAHPVHRPLPYNIIKKVLEKFSHLQQVSFQVLFLHYQKPLDPVDE